MGEYEPILRASFRQTKPISFRLPLAGAAVLVAACATPESSGSLADEGRFNRFNEASDISNNPLQGKFKRGFSSLGRLLVNSTIGPTTALGNGHPIHIASSAARMSRRGASRFLDGNPPDILESE